MTIAWFDYAYGCADRNGQLVVGVRHRLSPDFNAGNGYVGIRRKNQKLVNAVGDKVFDQFGRLCFGQAFLIFALVGFPNDSPDGFMRDCR